MTAELFLSSAQQFSSLPARTVTSVPSPTSPSATTLNATGSVLLERQCGGSTVHTKWGLPVRTSSPGCSDRKSPRVRSARMSDVIFVYVSWSSVELVSGDTAPLVAPVRCILDTRARCVLHIESECDPPATSHRATRPASRLSPRPLPTRTHHVLILHALIEISTMILRPVARERTRGHLTRWRHGDLATLFSPVNEKFGDGLARDARGWFFPMPPRGGSPARGEKTFH